MSQSDLRGSQLDSIDLQNADLSMADFRFSIMQGANLSRTNLHQANLSEVVLDDVIFDFADLSEANLSGASIINASLVNANLTGTVLAGADLTAAILDNAIMAGTIFVLDLPVLLYKTGSLTYQDFFNLLKDSGCPDGIFLVQSEPQGTVEPVLVNFERDSGVNLYSSRVYQDAVAYLCLASLNSAKLRSLEGHPYYFPGVDLSGSDLSSSDLSQAVLEQVLSGDGWRYSLVANLEGIEYNIFTQWPLGFSPPPSTTQSPESTPSDND
jgi:uncharacterized protein YjbI with pentapeptide repeats